MKTLPINCLIICALFCSVLVGCQRMRPVCQHMIHFVDGGNGRYTMNECLDYLEQLEGRCTKFDEVLNCMLEAQNQVDLSDNCTPLCEQEDDEE